MRCGRARLSEEFERAAIKLEQGRARFLCGDLYILPGDAAAPACLQRLERGFLGGEAGRVMLRGDSAARFAVSTLGLCVNALDETRRARVHFAYATDFDDVYTDGNNHGR